MGLGGAGKAGMSLAEARRKAAAARSLQPIWDYKREQQQTEGPELMLLSNRC